MSEDTHSRTVSHMLVRAHTDTHTHTDRNLRTFVERTQARSRTRAPSTLQTASLRWVAFAYENQEVSRLARLLLAKAKNGGGFRSCAGYRDRGNPRVGGCTTTATTEAAAARRMLSRFGRLKYSMASRSRLGMQISSGESHVPASGLILYPDSHSSTSPLPSSHFLCRAFSIYPPRSCLVSLSLDGSSFHLNVHRCFSSVTF